MHSLRQSGNLYFQGSTIYKAVKSDLKTALKKADAAVAENAENKEEVVRAAIKKVDMACTKGIMHKNAAARKVSQLAKKLG